MKSYDYYGYTFEADAYCLGCLPVSFNEEGVMPIFADSEWDYYPVCSICGKELDYVQLIGGE